MIVVNYLKEDVRVNPVSVLCRGFPQFSHILFGGMDVFLVHWSHLKDAGSKESSIPSKSDSDVESNQIIEVCVTDLLDLRQSIPTSIFLIAPPMEYPGHLNSSRKINVFHFVFRYRHICIYLSPVSTQFKIRFRVLWRNEFWQQDTERAPGRESCDPRWPLRGAFL